MGGGEGAGEGEGGRRGGRRGGRGHRARRAHHNAHHRAQQRRQHRRHRQHAAWRRRRHGLFGRKRWGVTGLGHRRRQRRVRYTGGSGASGGSGSLFCCCFGIQPKTPTQQNEEDLQTLQRYQNEIIECHKQELALKQEVNADQGADMRQDPPSYHTVMGTQPQGGAFGTNQSWTGTHPGPIPSTPGMVPPPVAGQQVADMPSAPSAPPPTYDEVMAQDAQELQREQHELLNDILDQQREETDPERLEELYRQQRELIGQMEQFHAAGFQYAGDIPPVPQYGGPGIQSAPTQEVMDVDIAVNS